MDSCYEAGSLYAISTMGIDDKTVLYNVWKKK